MVTTVYWRTAFKVKLHIKENKIYTNLNSMLTFAVNFYCFNTSGKKILVHFYSFCYGFTGLKENTASPDKTGSFPMQNV